MILKLAEDCAQRLQQIELEAGRRFADIGMPEIASAPPTGIPILQDAARSGFLWGASISNQLGGFILCDRFGDHFLIRQLSVLPGYSGMRIGSHLIEQVSKDASRIDCRHLILSTFRQVPWNAPYYQRLGFEIMRHEDFPDFIRRIRSEEARVLDIADRVIMQRLVAGPRGVTPVR
jgi:GNAT superfamily N-acetyltransferase